MRKDANTSADAHSQFRVCCRPRPWACPAGAGLHCGRACPSAPSPTHPAQPSASSQTSCLPRFDAGTRTRLPLAFRLGGSQGSRGELSCLENYWQTVQPNSFPREQFQLLFALFGICQPSWESGELAEGITLLCLAIGLNPLRGPALGFAAGVPGPWADFPSRSVFDARSRGIGPASLSGEARTLCLVTYSITRSLLLSNSRLSGTIITATRAMTFPLHAGNAAETSLLKVPPRGSGLPDQTTCWRTYRHSFGPLECPCEPPVLFENLRRFIEPHSEIIILFFLSRGTISNRDLISEPGKRGGGGGGCQGRKIQG